MAKRTQSKNQERRAEEEERHHPRPFWSGVIAFGLVSLPVSLFPANRGKPVSLRMVDNQGNQLRRGYLCEKENRMLEREEIVRGYPVEKNQFVIVEDEELEALAPEKTREIDLRRFVPLDEINPVYFERGYFLTPDSGSTKAYRLLAKSMAEEQRAGIATFVMRDREYLIAIMAEGGILRAETLRFHDEIRSPQQVGLPDEFPKPSKKLSQKVDRALKAHDSEKLDPELLVEQQVQQLRTLVDAKLANRKDIVEDERPSESTEDGDNVIDLMQVLKERLQGKGGNHPPSSAEIEQLSKDELYEKARELHIAGRSKMTKQELAQALKEAG